MAMDILIISFTVISFVLSIISMLIGIFAFVELRSFMKSTHKVEFVPFDEVPLKKEPKLNDELEQYGLI